MYRRVSMLLLAAAFAAGPAAAADQGCAAFKWSVETERTLFADPAIKAVASGATLPELPPTALAISLTEASHIQFALPPAGKPKPGASNGALLNIGSVTHKGHYQVTLSDEGWIDLIQGSQFAASYDHSGAHDCPGIRKSVRFDLDAAPLVIQLSGTTASRLLLVIRPVD